MSKFDRRYLRLARFIAQDWSKDPSTKVAAVIADKTGKPVSFGFNGFAAGVEDTPERLSDRPTKYALMVHAERNAIIFADRSRLDGATMYLWPFPPCSECASMIAQAGLARLVTIHPTAEHLQRWEQSFKTMRIVMRETGVQLITHDPDCLDFNEGPAYTPREYA